MRCARTTAPETEWLRCSLPCELASIVSLFTVGPAFGDGIIQTTGLWSQVTSFLFFKNCLGTADGRQQLPGKSSRFRAHVRRVRLRMLFVQHQQLLVRPCVCSTERSALLLGQPFLLRGVVFCGKSRVSYESIWEGFIQLPKCTLFSRKQELL